MRELLYKEWKLALHPAVPLFLCLSALMLVPNYPYYVTFFYTGLGIFFICLNGRENEDIRYTLALPVCKRDAVRARFAFAVGLELAQLLLAVPFAILRQRLPLPGNQVGMDANVAFFGLSLAMLGLFNAVFFGAYYRNPIKVGKAFALSSTALFLYILVVETLDHVLALFRDRLDTPDPRFLSEKLIVLALGTAAYVLSTALTYRKSVKTFDKLDL